MVNVYEKSRDLHIRKTYIYVKNGDTYAYSDVACTEKIKEADLKYLFLMGAVVVDAGVLYSPVSYRVATGVGTLTYAKTDGTTATTAVLSTVVSEEYTAG
jgi:hypothetical protein